MDLAAGERERRANLRRLLRYARPHVLAFAALSITSLLLTLTALLQPWPVKLLVDNVIGRAPLPGPLEVLFELGGEAPSAGTLLVLVVAASLALFALTSALEAAASWLATATGRRMTYGLAQRLFANLQRRSLAYHRRVDIGDTITSVGEDCWSVFKLFDAVIFQPLHAVIAIILTLAFMLQINAALMLLALAVAPITVTASRLAGRHIQAIAEVQRRLEGRMRAHVHQVLTGMSVVQAFNREDEEELRFRTYAADSMRARQRSTLALGVNRLASGLVSTIGTAIVLGASAYEVIAGRLTVGELLVVVAYLTSLQGSFRKLTEAYPTAQMLSASLDRLDEGLHTPPEVAERPGAVALARVRGAIRFEDVSFAYDEARPILHNISLEVEPGKTLALVGPTGAGKTTLAGLIPRFFDPTHGRVLIDGQDVRDMQLASLRAQVSLVPQEAFLFPFTVAENIAYGRPTASLHEIETAARGANAHDFICRLPNGYDTVLGEHGATLSGGERQRIAIARALLKDSGILILDEPTSAVDSETEEAVIAALRNLVRGRTTLIIAHRLTTVRHADRIVVMQDGRIVESGSYETVILQGQRYAQYVQAPLQRILS